VLIPDLKIYVKPKYIDYKVFLCVLIGLKNTEIRNSFNICSTLLVYTECTRRGDRKAGRRPAIKDDPERKDRHDWKKIQLF